MNKDFFNSWFYIFILLSIGVILLFFAFNSKRKKSTQMGEVKLFGSAILFIIFSIVFTYLKMTSTTR